MALKLGSTGSALRVGSTTAKYARVGTTLKSVAPPLDIAGSAAAAYSLRKLSYAYTGPVVEVRRSSDNTTADFTADEVEDGTLAAWVGAGNDGFVATWYDQSGNSRDATQATAGSQPQVVSSGAVILKEGKPALRFDGSDDYLDAVGYKPSGAVGLFCVFTYDSFSSVGLTLSCGKTTVPSGGFQVFNYHHDPATIGFQTGLGGTWVDGVNELNLGEYDLNTTLVAFQATASGTTMHIRGASILDSPAGLIVSGNDLRIGENVASASSYPFDGTLSELIIYHSDQTSNRTAIEGNLCWHYGLENKLPYNHAEVKPQTLPTDTDVLAFAAASGATSIPDLLKVEDLVAYLKAESLWDYARFYPMKSAQNAGSGSTVYGLGGLTSNNMTLVNSPTWGSDGVTFNGSTQYGNVGDLWSGADFTALTRFSLASAALTADAAILSNWDPATDDRRLLYLVLGTAAFDNHALAFSSDGGLATVFGRQATNSVATTADQVAGFSITSTGALQLYQGKTQLTQTAWIGSAQSSLYDNASDIYYAANAQTDGSAGLHTEMESAALIVFSGAALTTTQRETITDLINAL